MQSSAVLEMLRSRGMSVTASSGCLIVAHDREVVDADRDLIGIHRSNLLVLLEQEVASPTRRTISSDQRWRKTVAWWPLEWRQRWADLAEAHQVADEPWDRAEWLAFLATDDAVAEAEARGETVPIVEPRSALSEANASAEITALGWSGASLVEVIESGRRHNEAVINGP